MNMTLHKCAALPAIIVFFVFCFAKKCFNDTKNTSSLRPIIYSTLLLKKSYGKSMKKRPQQATTKNEVKRIFVIKENSKKKIHLQKLLFLISQNGRPDEKKEKLKKQTRGRHTPVNNVSK